MDNKKMLHKIEELKLVPVVKIDYAEDTKPLCEALCTGGLPVAEITFRTDAAEEAIKTACREFPDMLVGAGTIVNVEQAKRAVDAGARFIVSPGLSRSVVEYAVDNQLPVFPGVCTPTEVMIAMEYNLPVLKFFPAKNYGGLQTIKALAAPFNSIRFMPTGGINAENVREYLAYDRIIACGGSWMVAAGLIKEKKFDEVTRLTKEAVDIVKL